MVSAPNDVCVLAVYNASATPLLLVVGVESEPTKFPFPPLTTLKLTSLPLIAFPNASSNLTCSKRVVPTTMLLSLESFTKVSGVDGLIVISSEVPCLVKSLVNRARTLNVSATVSRTDIVTTESPPNPYVGSGINCAPVAPMVFIIIEDGFNTPLLNASRAATRILTVSPAEAGSGVWIVNSKWLIPPDTNGNTIVFVTPPILTSIVSDPNEVCVLAVYNASATPLLLVVGVESEPTKFPSPLLTTLKFTSLPLIAFPYISSSRT